MICSLSLEAQDLSISAIKAENDYFSSACEARLQPQFSRVPHNDEEKLDFDDHNKQL